MSSIAKNAAFMTIASVGQKIISFVYFTIIARSVGVSGTGKYFFALSFTTIFVVFVDLGLTNVLVRESAKIREKTQEYFSTILSVKIILGILAYLGAVVAINLLGYPIETKHLVYLSAVTMIFDSFHLSIYGVLRAIGNLKFEAFSIVASQFVSLILGGTFLYFRLPLIYLILAYTIPSCLNAIFASSVLYFKYKIQLIPSFNLVIFKYLGKIAIPFALAAVFARVYSYIDSILLSKLAGDTAVGWYSIPYKITYAFQFIPLALVAAIYPRFSEYYTHDRGRLSFIFERAIKYLLIIVFPIAVGIAVLAKQIIFLLYTPEFANSILPLQILIVSLIFAFISFPVGAFLNACDRQVTQTTIVGFVMVVNIVLNLLLIPDYGVTGAAISALVGNILLTVIGFIVIVRITDFNFSFITKTVIQLVLSAGVMGLLVWFVNRESNLVFAIITGLGVYPIMLFLTSTISKKQLKEAIYLVRK